MSINKSYRCEVEPSQEDSLEEMLEKEKREALRLKREDRRPSTKGIRGGL